MTEKIANLDKLIALHEKLADTPTERSVLATLKEFRALLTAANPLQAVLDKFPLDGEEEKRIDALRLAAFKSNDEKKLNDYYRAVSTWFQHRHYRAIDAHAAFNATLQCPHEIDSEKVVLKADSSKPGNALAQLHTRLSALETTPAPVSDPPKVYLDWATMTAYDAEFLDEPAGMQPLWGAPTPVSEITDAARDVLSERQRQTSAEGWTVEHDDAHTDGELSTAAGCYALGDKLPMREVDGPGTIVAPVQWPWFGCWWKPKTRRQDLVRAGALIIAEIERLDRSAAMVGE